MSGRSLKRALTVFVAAALGTTGCGLGYLQTGSPPAIAVRVAKGEATIVVTPKFVEADAYRPLALIEKNTKGRIHHLTLSLLKREGTEYRPVLGPDSQPVAVTLPSSELDSTVELSGLAFNSDYRVTARAFKNPGNSPPDKISREDRSFVDVAVGQDPRPISQAIEVHLLDRPFAAAGDTSISLIPGALAADASARVSVSRRLTTIEVLPPDAQVSPNAVRPQGTLAAAMDPITGQSFPINDQVSIESARLSGHLIVSAVEYVETNTIGDVSAILCRVDFGSWTTTYRVNLAAGVPWEDPGPGFTISDGEWQALLLGEELFPSGGRTIQAWSVLTRAVITAFTIVGIILIVGYVGYKVKKSIEGTAKGEQDSINDMIERDLREQGPAPSPSPGSSPDAGGAPDAGTVGTKLDEALKKLKDQATGSTTGSGSATDSNPIYDWLRNQFPPSGDDSGLPDNPNATQITRSTWVEYSEQYMNWWFSAGSSEIPRGIYMGSVAPGSDPASNAKTISFFGTSWQGNCDGLRRNVVIGGVSVNAGPYNCSGSSHGTVTLFVDQPAALMRAGG